METCLIFTLVSHPRWPVFFFPLLYLLYSQHIGYLCGLLDVQITEQNVNSKTERYLRIKQVNVAHILELEMFLKVQ